MALRPDEERVRQRLARARAILPKLNDATGAKHVSETRSKDGRCGVCGEKRKLGFDIGDWCLRWNCINGCDRRAVRDWLLSLGFTDDDLGPFAREAAPTAATPIDHRAECDRLRAKLATADSKNAAVLAALADSTISKETELRARIWLAATGEKRPDNYRGIYELAMRAGASSTRAKALAADWLSDLLLAG